jgi:hypothetical protein
MTDRDDDTGGFRCDRPSLCPPPRIGNAGEFSPDEPYYFGTCPHCDGNDGFIHIGRDEWFLCRMCKVTWCTGSELNEWRRQSEEYQIAAYDHVDFGSYRSLDFDGRLPTHDDIVAFWRRRY